MITLQRLVPSEVQRERTVAVDPEAREVAARIISEVQADGEPALRRWAMTLGEIDRHEAPLYFDQAALAAAYEKLPEVARGALCRGAARIEAFARCQRAALVEVSQPIAGGACGHVVRPVACAGCYAPGGRFPLPSTVLMTAVTARVAGVERVYLASPKPTTATLAAAKVAAVDGVLAVGGAQAIAALAFGVGGVSACDAIVGPGNRFVTAAKAIVAGRVRIDMLAGPTELVVLADDSADPHLLAADLLGQAEHDVDATPILVSTSEPLVGAVEAELARQLPLLATREVAQRSLRRQGAAVVVADIAEGIAVCDRLAPEHLQISTRDPASVAQRCRHYGALFIGEGSAEVVGDYCAGPNHTLPTGGTARYSGGLSVLDFLRVRTWIRIDDRAAADDLYRDAELFAEMEGLAGHGAAARARRTPS